MLDFAFLSRLSTALRRRKFSFFAAMAFFAFATGGGFESVCGAPSAPQDHEIPFSSSHPVNDACCVCTGAKQHPIKVTAKTLIKNGLIKSFEKMDCLIFFTIKELNPH